MTTDNLVAPYPFMALAQQALSKEVDSVKMLEILSYLVTKFKFEIDINKIDFSHCAYNIDLNCYSFHLEFMRPNIDIPLFKFLNTLNLETTISLFIDMDFNFHSIEFAYSLNNRTLIEGGGGRFIENYFRLEINYNNDCKLNTISYIFNNINKSKIIIKNNNMLSLLEEEIQFIDLFFQDPTIVQEVIPFWDTMGACDYSELNIKQSIDLIHMLNI